MVMWRSGGLEGRCRCGDEGKEVWRSGGEL
jgi:hypothetical protein